MSILNKLFGFSKKSESKPTIKIDIEKLIASDNINNSIIEIDNFISELCSWGQEIDKLTEPKKDFYFNQNLEREINNGGFEQYFFNSSGDFAHETIISLKAIGANKTVEILQQAIDQFPDKTVPKNRNKRQTILKEISETAKSVFGMLDQKFFLYEDDLNTLNMAFVRKNKAQF